MSREGSTDVEKRRIIYYTNELEDEFSRAQITPRVIDGSYVYDHKSLWKRFTHFFWYRLVATPIAFLYTKLVFHHKAVNKKLLSAGIDLSALMTAHGKK